MSFNAPIVRLIATIGSTLISISGKSYVDEALFWCLKYWTSWFNVWPLSNITCTLAEHMITERMITAIGSRRVLPGKRTCEICWLEYMQWSTTFRIFINISILDFPSSPNENSTRQKIDNTIDHGRDDRKWFRDYRTDCFDDDKNLRE